MNNSNNNTANNNYFCSPEFYIYSYIYIFHKALVNQVTSQLSFEGNPPCIVVGYGVGSTKCHIPCNPHEYPRKSQIFMVKLMMWNHHSGIILSMKSSW